jgi:hypothetical protein
MSAHYEYVRDRCPRAFVEDNYQTLICQHKRYDPNSAGCDLIDPDGTCTRTMPTLKYPLTVVSGSMVEINRNVWTGQSIGKDADGSGDCIVANYEPLKDSDTDTGNNYCRRLWHDDTANGGGAYHMFDHWYYSRITTANGNRVVSSIFSAYKSTCTMNRDCHPSYGGAKQVCAEYANGQTYTVPSPYGTASPQQMGIHTAMDRSNAIKFRFLYKYWVWCIGEAGCTKKLLPTSFTQGAAGCTSNNGEGCLIEYTCDELSPNNKNWYGSPVCDFDCRNNWHLCNDNRFSSNQANRNNWKRALHFRAAINLHCPTACAMLRTNA